MFYPWDSRLWMRKERTEIHPWSRRPHFLDGCDMDGSCTDVSKIRGQENPLYGVWRDKQIILWTEDTCAESRWPSVKHPFIHYWLNQSSNLVICLSGTRVVIPSSISLNSECQIVQSHHSTLQCGSSQPNQIDTVFIMLGHGLRHPAQHEQYYEHIHTE
jgi:hypothetical protein